MRLPRDPLVLAVFDSYSKPVRKRLLELRRLIFEAASETEGVGEIEETLKWGEPAYLTPQTRSGTTIRLGPVRSNPEKHNPEKHNPEKHNPEKHNPEKYALYLNCQTDLISTFRLQFKELDFDGNRAIVFNVEDDPPVEVVFSCIRAALTYHARKKRR